VLDVFETEPLPAESPLWAQRTRSSHRIVPPCMQAGTMRLSNIFLDNLDRFVRGAPLRNVVDPARGY
jgi:phosphoglycerate dehydrogenase-like enzyme